MVRLARPGRRPDHGETHPDLGVKFDADGRQGRTPEPTWMRRAVTADQLDLTLMFNTSSGHQKIAEAIQQMWKDNLGVNVKVVNQEWAVYLETIKDLEPPRRSSAWAGAWTTRMPTTSTCEVVHFGGSQNPADGRRSATGRTTSTKSWSREAAVEADPAKRVDMYAQAEEILVKTDAVMIPIYWYTTCNRDQALRRSHLLCPRWP